MIILWRTSTWFRSFQSPIIFSIQPQSFPLKHWAKILALWYLVKIIKKTTIPGVKILSQISFPPAARRLLELLESYYEAKMPGQPRETLSILYQAHDRWLFTFHHRLDLGWIFKVFCDSCYCNCVLVIISNQKKGLPGRQLAECRPGHRRCRSTRRPSRFLSFVPWNPPRCWKHLKQFAHPQTHIIVRLQVYKIYTRSI